VGTNGIDPMNQLRAREKCPTTPNKKIYKNSAEAVEAAGFRSKETGLNIQSYACPGCGWFHLTSSPVVKDKVVKAPVGITTTTMKRNTPMSTPAIPIRKDMTSELPIMPANFDAKLKVLRTELYGKKSATKEELLAILPGTSKNSLGNLMKRAGWYNTRGPKAVWKPNSEKSTAAPIIHINQKEKKMTDQIDATMDRHPAGKDFDQSLDSYKGLGPALIGSGSTGAINLGTTTTTYDIKKPAFLDWRTMDLEKIKHMTVGDLIKTLEVAGLEIRVQAAFTD